MREELANYAHDAWSGWMKYLFEKSKQNDDGTVTIPVWARRALEETNVYSLCKLVRRREKKRQGGG